MKNKWRLNFVINYWTGAKIEISRTFILEQLRSFAILYRLDYATSVEHQFASCDNSIEPQKPLLPADLFYFRSNIETKISKRDFRKVIALTFDKPHNTQFGLVEFHFQMLSFLKVYPFPLEFYRPLNYPFVEQHKGCHKSILVYSEPVMVAIENRQDHPLN